MQQQREWTQAPTSNDISLKTIINKITDPTSKYSVIACGVISFIISALLLIYFKPEFVLNDNYQLSGAKVLFISLIIACITGGGSYYLQQKYN